MSTKTELELQTKEEAHPYWVDSGAKGYWYRRMVLALRRSRTYPMGTHKEKQWMAQACAYLNAMLDAEASK